ncbi:hypothetical protein BDZ88DRAFT_249102 [Geranomyces variabilis]|nr:hypothetical protein BDZ88DRAFT_249102 [Geranomyces variabilis]KAJ3134048.1 hypothetical protein HDU90_005396 [Geranomyces variabilis]
MPIFVVVTPSSEPLDTLASFPCPAAPSAAMLRTIIEILYPALARTPYELAERVVDVAAPGGVVLHPVHPDCPSVPPLTIVHAAGDMTSAPELGVRAERDPRMIKARRGAGSKRGGPLTTTDPSGSNSPASRKSSRGSVTAGPSSQAHLASPVEVVTALQRLVAPTDSQRTNWQSKLRSCVMRRDQVCVVTGAYEESELEAAHVLTTEYATSWLTAERLSLLSSTPNGLGVFARAYDARVALTMSRNTHSLFDNFAFSIYVGADKVARIFVFAERDRARLRHGKEVTLPTAPSRSESADYFASIFPSPEILNEHFRQAVLANCQGAAEPAEDEAYEGDDGGALASEAEVYDAILERGAEMVTEEGFQGDDAEVFAKIIETGSSEVTLADFGL